MPSAGSVHAAPYVPAEPVVSVPMVVTVPPTQSAVVQLENTTCSTPVPVSVAVALTVNGSADAALM